MALKCEYRSILGRCCCRTTCSRSCGYSSLTYPHAWVVKARSIYYIYDTYIYVISNITEFTGCLRPVQLQLHCKYLSWHPVGYWVYPQLYPVACLKHAITGIIVRNGARNCNTAN
jgi:hypothetical protein